MTITSTAPGRICLFGEHQDYLGFPVITAAIDRCISIRGEVGGRPEARIDLPDINSSQTFPLPPRKYTQPRDYLRSCARVLSGKGLLAPIGIRATVSGNIPIQAGTSSSSALVVAWTAFLLSCSATGRSLLNHPLEIAELAFQAEVVEFGESGGRMDQFASACGGTVYLDFHDETICESLPPCMRDFILADSLQPKDTPRTLKRLNQGQSEALKQLMNVTEERDPHSLTAEHLESGLSKIDPQLRRYAYAAVSNHWITRSARQRMKLPQPDLDGIANLMNRLQVLLRDDLLVSTPRINDMVDAALSAGARAAKINGSGEGGCIFAWCPGHEDAVSEAIRRVGGQPMRIRIGPGVRVSKNPDSERE